jgi:hypothetical protein
MAGNARFHDKSHRKNHHTLSSYGFPDSATDPIASHAEPFQGDFVINGSISTNAGLQFLSADLGGDIYCENIHVRDVTYTNFISGASTETIISDGALTGYGNNTLTLDFQTGVYTKTPIFNVSGTSSVFNTNVYANSSVTILNGNTALNALNVYQSGNASYIIMAGYGDTPNSFVLNRDGIELYGSIITHGDIQANDGNVTGTNISLLQTASSKYDSVYSTVSSNSAKWLSGSNDTDFTANNINIVNSLSVNKIIPNTVYVSLTSLYLTATENIQLSVTSPTFWFITPSVDITDTSINVILPSVDTTNIGIIFYVKNLYAGLNTCDVNICKYGELTAIYTVLGNTSSYRQLVWDGTNWQSMYNN